MNCRGDVLLADDQETFRESTADLLRGEGYRCDIASDASEAEQLLRSSRYDVLISDIRMPGNAGLEFIGGLKETAAGMPVILVTGYPSLTSAVYSVQLPVIAYLVKPFDFDELLPFVRVAVERSATYRTISKSRQRLETLSGLLHRMECAFRESVRLPCPGAGDTFPSHAAHDSAGGSADALQVEGLFTTGDAQTGPDGIGDLNEELDRTRDVLREAIKVLGETKSAFKSKRLGQLRRRLEDIVNRPGT